MALETNWTFDVDFASLTRECKDQVISRILRQLNLQINLAQQDTLHGSRAQWVEVVERFDWRKN